jgi:hypothetical protein
MSDTDKPARRKSTQGRYRPPTWRSLVVILAGAGALSVYLFVTAPPPLAATAPPSGRTIAIDSVLAMLERENDAARALWTQEIVAQGKTAGLSFDEHWRDDNVHAGPLPALFLRETARNLERTSLRLNLFLGSPFPINGANRFTPDQGRQFASLGEKGVQFRDPSTGMHTAMFPDVAISEACVSCHNEHADSPKHDWRINDVMGATTWMYPEESVTVDRAMELVRALRKSIRETYASYLAKAATFPSPPAIGTQWPRDGYALPSEEEFMRELGRRTSSATLLSLLDPQAPTLEEPAAAVDNQPAARDMLVIRAARSTRVIVERAGQRLLIARLVPGSVTTLSSSPPLRVQLSAAEGVEVEYDTHKIAVPARDNQSKDVEVVVEPENRERS